MDEWLGHTGTNSAHHYQKMKDYILGAIAASLVAVLMSVLAPLTDNTVPSVSQAIDWYLLQLEVFPVWTKSITTCIIQITGDIFAQIYEMYCDQEEATTTISKNRLRNFNFDVRRGMSMAADGLFLSGPLLHYAFEVMERALPTEEEDAGLFSMATMWHVLANDYIVDTIYLFFSFIFVAVAEGLAQDLPQLIRKDMVAIWKTSWRTSVMLMPVEYLCFSRLPLQLRVLSMNCVDILWGAIISFVTHHRRHHHHHSAISKESSS
mmetsp:Transcript_23698/g.68117  ORF Transcript_23698/g.68117 Transcript_23698/m.68117 type:complete len:264 (-) Transcript_23698:112-903(-)